MDADLDCLARLEAERVVGRADEGKVSRLGVRYGQYPRSETSGSPTQVCPPNGYSAFHAIYGKLELFFAVDGLEFGLVIVFNLT